MRKKLVSIKNFADLGDLKKRITNVFSEGSEDAAKALRAVLDELENAEVEVDEEMLAERIREVLASAEPSDKIQNAISDAVAKRVAALQNSVKKELPKKVRNEVCTAVLKARGREDVENAVRGVLTKNGIDGFDFADVIDFTIVENWGDSNPIFKQLHKTMYTRFFYTEQDFRDSGVIAHEWDKFSSEGKEVQEIIVQGKTIYTSYIYKRQQVAQEDMDEIERAGEASNFLRFINEELDRQIVNTIVGYMMGQVSENFANIPKLVDWSATSSDVFREIVNESGLETDDFLVALRKIADKVKNPYNKRKVMVLNPYAIEIASRMRYGAGGTIAYHSLAELAGMLGVDEVIPYDFPVDGDSGGILIPALCFIPDGIWYVEKKSISVSYPQWEKNVMNYQKERNIGMAIHDLKSVAFCVLHERNYKIQEQNSNS